MDVTDLFLALTFAVKFYSEKTLIKKLYSSYEHFVHIFTLNTNNFKLQITNEEHEKINRLKAEVKKIIIEELKNSLKEKEIKFVAFCEKDYPLKLKDISDSPLGLFYKGNLSNLNTLKHVAIVGTRSSTNYGNNITKKISFLLAERDIVVVSGLASGIDTCAHMGSVKSGKTVAVVGTGVDSVFPFENKELASEIISNGGLIVSEYPPETPAVPWNFPQRNRIISALSDAVIVIEGDLQSGAMITARFAIKQGKPLFALPGPIDSVVSNGPNILIKSKVAELLVSVDDILEKIGESKQIKLDLKSNDEKLNNLSEKEKNIYKLLSSNSKSFEALIQETNLEVQELLKYLSMLELKGFVEKMQDGGYVRCLA